MSAGQGAGPVPAPEIERAAGIIRAGGLVAYPTETFYGLGADPFQPQALESLLAAKGRESGKPIALIAGSLEAVEAAYGPLSDLAQTLALSFWPGPLTLVLPAPAHWPRALRGSSGGTGVRVAGLAVARKLASAAGGLITATSANASGGPPARTAEEARSCLPEGCLGMVLDGGPAPGGEPSTVLDLTSDPPRIVRAGAIGLDRLRQVALPIPRISFDTPQGQT